MKNKLYTSIGLMSGTSMDGIDISIIQSDGQYEFYNILDDYYEYDVELREELIRSVSYTHLTLPTILLV